MTTELAPSKAGPFRVFLKTTVEDLGLLLYYNKPLIVFSLLVVFILSPLMVTIRQYRFGFDQDTLYNDPGLRVVEGEGSMIANAKTGYWIAEEPGVFNGKYLALYTNRLPMEGQIVFKYRFAIDREGVYRLFVAGSPPGALESEGYEDFSPYEVVIDGGLPVVISYERKDSELKKLFRDVFYSTYSYKSGMAFTKIGEFDLGAGEHTVEFVISAPRFGTDKYKFLLDAFFIVPGDWQPRRQFLTLPDDLFSY